MDMSRQPALEVNSYGLGDFQPYLTRGHDRRPVGGPHPGGEGPDTPIGAGVRIRPDDQIAWQNKLLQHQLMADALLIEKVQAVFSGEIPEELVRSGRIFRGRRNVVIQNNRDQVW